MKLIYFIILVALIGCSSDPPQYKLQTWTSRYGDTAYVVVENQYNIDNEPVYVRITPFFYNKHQADSVFHNYEMGWIVPEDTTK